MADVLPAKQSAPEMHQTVSILQIFQLRVVPVAAVSPEGKLGSWQKVDWGCELVEC